MSWINRAQIKIHEFIILMLFTVVILIFYAAENVIFEETVADNVDTIAHKFMCKYSLEK